MTDCPYCAPDERCALHQGSVHERINTSLWPDQAATQAEARKINKTGAATMTAQYEIESRKADAALHLFMRQNPTDRSSGTFRRLLLEAQEAYRQQIEVPLEGR